MKKIYLLPFIACLFSGNSSAVAPALTLKIAEFAEKLQNLEQGLAQAVAQQAANGWAQHIANTNQRVDALEQAQPAIGALDQRLTTLEQAPPPINPSALTDITKRLTALENAPPAPVDPAVKAALDQLEQNTAATGDRLNALITFINGNIIAGSLTPLRSALQEFINVESVTSTGNESAVAKRINKTPTARDAIAALANAVPGNFI